MSVLGLPLCVSAWLLGQILEVYDRRWQEATAICWHCNPAFFLFVCLFVSFYHQLKQEWRGKLGSHQQEVSTKDVCSCKGYAPSGMRGWGQKTELNIWTGMHLEQNLAQPAAGRGWFSLIQPDLSNDWLHPYQGITLRRTLLHTCKRIVTHVLLPQHTCSTRRRVNSSSRTATNSFPFLVLHSLFHPSFQPLHLLCRSLGGSIEYRRSGRCSHRLPSGLIVGRGAYCSSPDPQPTAAEAWVPQQWGVHNNCQWGEQWGLWKQSPPALY